METKEEARAYRLTVRESLVGDRQFYKRVGMIVLPIIVQNTLSNVVSLLDNVMVGRVGTLPMSAVAISNQLLFVFYVCVFGLLAGAGIYGTQFFGKGDMEGVRNTLRFKIVACMILCVAVILLFSLAQDPLIRLYIADTTSEAEAAATLAYGKQYLSIMLIGLIPTGITQCVAGTMREGGKTILPMVASMTAMTVNFFLNLLLIFGYLGFPKMGVAGAAVATVISRFVEVFVIFIGYKRKPEKYRFMKGLLKNFRVPKELIPPLMKNAMPLLLNEFLWSFSQAVFGPRDRRDRFAEHLLYGVEYLQRGVLIPRFGGRDRDRAGARGEPADQRETFGLADGGVVLYGLSGFGRGDVFGGAADPAGIQYGE